MDTDHLRSLVQDCIAKHLYATAVFYADKLVTLTQYGPGDVFLLAQTYFVSRQYRRAFSLLKTHGIMEDIRFKYLAAKSLAESEAWEECLALLGDGEPNEDENGVRPGPSPSLGAEISMQAAVCLLRAQALEALDNRACAIRWYKAALAADPYCQEAFSALIQHQLLTNSEELSLVDSLQVGPGDGWITLLYRCQCKKYAQQQLMEQQLEQLEQPCSSSSSMPAETPAAATPAATPAAAAGGQSSPEPAAMAISPPTSAAAATKTPGSSGKRGGRRKKQQLQQQQQQQQGMTGPTPMSVSTCMDGGREAVAPAAAAAARVGEAGSSGRSSVSGYGLAGATDVMACRAAWYLHLGRYQEAYRLTQQALTRDPYALECLETHVVAALQLGKKNELYLRSHKLVEEYPQQALSWFAVGCYYMATRQYDQARHYFGKATALDRNSAAAWVGFGHAFAAQDESDQALAAYRTAARLFPGLHTPVLGMGMEYTRMHNLHLAEGMFLKAQQLCPGDPLVAHELGVLANRNGQYEAAANWFKHALQLVPVGKLTATWEPTLVNLAHSLRKQQQYTAAIELYEHALGLCPLQAGTHAALAYTHQLRGDTEVAVVAYHRALGLRPDDSFSGEMLGLALERECLRFSAELETLEPTGVC